MTAYATVAQLKRRLGLSNSDYDDQLTDRLEGASREVEHFTRRIFNQSAAGTARIFKPCDWYRFDLPDFNDLATLVSLKTDEDGDGVFEVTWSSATDFITEPVNQDAYPDARPIEAFKAIGQRLFPLLLATFPAREHRVQVTGTWGWTTVPSAVVESTLILAQEGFRLKDAPFGVAGIEDFGPIRVTDNPAARRKLEPLQRGTGRILMA